MVRPPIPILIQIALGAIAGWYYIKIMKRSVFGNLWGAIVVGIIGSVLGCIALDGIFTYLINNPLTVNFVAAFFGAFLLIWIFSKLAHQ